MLEGKIQADVAKVIDASVKHKIVINGVVEIEHCGEDKAVLDYQNDVLNVKDEILNEVESTLS